MRKYFVILFIVFISCQVARKGGQKDVITVTILPQKYFVERIAGELAEVNVLIPPGASPELYSLVPSQLKDVVRSKAWLRMGHVGFELSWTDKIIAANPDMQTFVLSEGIDLIVGEEERHDDHAHAGGVDPHFWMSPREVFIIAENTMKALVQLYPDHELLFRENFEKLKTDIEETDRHISEVLAGTRNRSFLVFHPALTYFARQYGLEQVALEKMGKEPSPKHVKEVVQFAREKNIRVIFIQKEFDRTNARIIAEEINGSIVQINPLAYDWLAQMKETTENLKNALN
ncbi:MAG: zinc ABC transporter substrate-binding protein [Prolixibacteraceae bacterium]|jgi:zinc transport system substrate-binding protein|nr:zinc ABC transporter substrate-binding protein [Prolixibacteraceae bacterium]